MSTGQAKGQVIRMSEIKNTWKYICSKRKTDALSQEIYLARDKLNQMKAIYLSNNETDRWNEYITKWEAKYKLKYIPNEDNDQFVQRYINHKLPTAPKEPQLPKYTAYIRTPTNTYQIEPTTSLTTLNDHFKKKLRELVKSKELTKEQAREQHNRLVSLIGTVKALIIERSEVRDPTKTTRPYKRRKISA